MSEPKKADPSEIPALKVLLKGVTDERERLETIEDFLYFAQGDSKSPVVKAMRLLKRLAEALLEHQIDLQHLLQSHLQAVHRSVEHAEKALREECRRVSGSSDTLITVAQRMENLFVHFSENQPKALAAPLDQFQREAAALRELAEEGNRRHRQGTLMLGGAMGLLTLDFLTRFL